MDPLQLTQIVGVCHSEIRDRRFDGGQNNEVRHQRKALQDSRDMSGCTDEVHPKGIDR
jgi:hypothetical protein